MKAYTRTFGWLAILAVLMFVAAGCGSDDDSSGDASSAANKATTASTSTSATTTSTGSAVTAPATVSNDLKLSVDPGKFTFDSDSLSATAGDVTITLTNTESIQHNIALKDSDGEVLATGELVGEGGTSTITVKHLKPGTYKFFCTPHESIGMKGTLTVA